MFTAISSFANHIARINLSKSNQEKFDVLLAQYQTSGWIGFSKKKQTSNKKNEIPSDSNNKLKVKSLNDVIGESTSNKKSIEKAKKRLNKLPHNNRAKQAELLQNINPCALLISTPSEVSQLKLPDKAKSAYVIVGDALYYVDGLTKKCVLVSTQNGKYVRAAFKVHVDSNANEKSTCLIEALSCEQLELIASPNHAHQGLMQKVLGNNWKNHPIVQNYWPYAKYLPHTSIGLLYLYDTILPAMTAILLTEQRRNKSEELKNLLHLLEEEKLALEYAILSHIQNTFRKCNLKNDDVLFSLREDLEEQSENFKLDFATACKTAKIKPHQKPHEGMRESTWTRFCELLASSKNSEIRTQFETMWENENKKGYPIQFEIIRFPDKSVIIPELIGIPTEKIPPKPKRAWLHPGHHALHVFFQTNLHTFVEINHTIKNVRVKISKLGNTLTLAEIVALINELRALAALLEQAKKNAEKTKFGWGIGDIFFKETNAILDACLNNIIAAKKAANFLSLEKALLEKIVTQSKEVCWTDTYSATPENLATIRHFITRVAGQLETEEKGETAYYTALKRNAPERFTAKQMLALFLEKVKQGEFVVRKDDMSQVDNEKVNSATSLALKFAETRATQEAVDLLGRLVTADKSTLALTRREILSKLSALFPTVAKPEAEAEKLLSVIQETYLYPHIFYHQPSNEFQLLKHLYGNDSEKIKMLVERLVEEARQFVEGLIETQELITESKAVKANFYLKKLQEFSDLEHNYYGSTIKRFERYVESFQGQNNFLHPVISLLDDTNLIINYGKKLIDYYIAHNQFDELLKEPFFRKNKDTLRTHFTKAIKTYCKRTDIPVLSEELLQFIAWYAKPDQEYDLLTIIDRFRYETLASQPFSQPLFEMALGIILTSELHYPLTQTGIDNFTAFLAGREIKWCEPLQQIITVPLYVKLTLKQHSHYKGCLKLKWLTCVLHDESQAQSYHNNFTAWTDDDASLTETFGLENILTVLTDIKNHLLDERRVNKTSLNIIKKLVNHGVEENNDEAVALLSEIKNLVIHAEYKLESSQRLARGIRKLKKLFADALREHNADSLNNKLKEFVEGNQFYEDSNCAEKANEKQQTIDEFLQWLITELFDEHKSATELAFIRILIKELSEDLASPYMVQLKKLESRYDDLKKLQDIDTEVSLYLTTSGLKLNIDAELISVIAFIPKPNLKILDEKIVTACAQLTEDNPIKPVLLLIIKTIQEPLNPKNNSGEITHSLIKSFTAFQGVVNYLAKILNPKLSSLSTTPLTEEIIAEFLNSPYCHPQYTSYWIQWISEIDKRGESDKISWLIKKFDTVLPPLVSSSLSAQNKKQQRQEPVVVQLTEGKNLILSFENATLSSNDMIWLWNWCRITECDVDRKTNQESFMQLTHFYQVYAKTLQSLYQKQSQVFHGFDLPNFRPLQKLLADKKLLHLFHFINADPDCPGGLVDGLILAYCEYSKKNGTEKLLTSIKPLIESMANDMQKKNFKELLSATEPDLSSSRNAIRKSMQENYYHCVSRMQRFLLLDTLYNHTVTLPFNRLLFFIPGEKLEFPLDFTEGMLSQLIELDNELDGSNKTSVVDKEKTVTKFWQSRQQKMPDDMHPSLKNYLLTFYENSAMTFNSPSNQSYSVAGKA
jgi:hypothetical protein